MLHLKSAWKAGTNSVDVEYTTPLERCKENYYLIKLDSIYSSALEDNPVITPISFKIQESSYIVSINTDEINYDRSIKNYCKHISTLLNGEGAGIHSRSSRSFLNTLLDHSPIPPSALFSDSATDNNVISRYFNLRLPAKTFLFSNNKYTLYALGYADEQILFIEDLQAHNLPQEIIQISAQLGKYASLKSIYLAPNNQAISRLPVDAPKGKIKWLDADTFDSVYFPERRRARYHNIDNLPDNRFRIRRDTIRPIYETSEKTLEIKSDDSKDIKERKVKKLQIWDNKAITLKIVRSGTRNPFNPSLLAPKTGQTENQAKYNYWRKAIVTTIHLAAKTSSAVPQIIIPSDYFDFSLKDEFTRPLKSLSEKDPKPYVQLGASAALIDYYSKLLSDLENEIKTESDTNVKATLNQKRRN